ncbi:MAG: HEAT repeat domain-containing protein [Planctomycetota bacterium]|jgi:hypothetical protein
MTTTAAIALLTATLASTPPEPLAALLEGDHELPRYAEQYYHPLGRVPVVDALLAEPLAGPVFARDSAAALRRAADTGSIARVTRAVHHVGGMPSRADDRAGVRSIDDVLARVAAAHGVAAEALAPVPESEREWMRAHPARWFVTEEDLTNLRYLTCDTTDHLRIFASAAAVDLPALASVQVELAMIADELLRAAAEGALDDLDDAQLPLRREAHGLVLVVAGRGNDVHDESVDVLIDLGGDDWYVNNAGGTEGSRPVALCIDLDGNDRYEASLAVQGAGFLGVGLLVDVAGDDVYRAGDLAQGAAFIGAGMLCDLGGNDRYGAHHLSQAAGAFGCGVLWDAAGDDEYTASGMAIGCAATQGIGVLVESGGDDRALAGIWRRERYSVDSGMGIGWSAGVRDWPWYAAPSFYGGLGLVDDAGGRDHYESRGGGMGGAYCLGAGIFIGGGDDDDEYVGFTDSMGASIHLGAAVCLEEGGDDRYRGQDSVLGVGGDRGSGIFFDLDGDDQYVGRNHALGTGRKPKAVGLFLDARGDDRYEFGRDSVTATWRPRNPENWAFASFLDLAGRDAYVPLTDEAGGLDRGNDRAWRFGPTGRGEDLESRLDAEDVFDALPRVPEDYRHERAYRPIVDETWTPAARAALEALRDAPPDDDAPLVAFPAPIRGWLASVSDADIHERRRLYERMDLLRFASGSRYEWSAVAELLDEPETAPADRLAFAGTWCAVDRTPGATARVADALASGTIPSTYARQILVRMVGRCGGPRAQEVLVDRLAHDPDPIVRRRAAWHLGRRGGADTLAPLAAAARTDVDLVRMSIASGLRDSTTPGALEIALRLRDDEELMIRRAAAISAVSMGHKASVQRLLDELGTRSIDTGVNYGRNLFADLAEYVGPDVLDRLGLDIDAWQAWWAEEGAAFDLAAATIAAEVYRQSRRRPPTSE